MLVTHIAILRQKAVLPVFRDSPALMTFSAEFLAIVKNSEVLPRYMYSMLRSLTRMGPSGSLKRKKRFLIYLKKISFSGTE